MKELIIEAGERPSPLGPKNPDRKSESQKQGRDQSDDQPKGNQEPFPPTFKTSRSSELDRYSDPKSEVENSGQAHPTGERQKQRRGRFSEQNVEFAPVHEIRELPKVSLEEGREKRIGREEDPEKKEGLVLSPPA